MGQLFASTSNVLARYAFFGAVPALLVLYSVVLAVDWSGWATGEREVVEQPVPFSHQHHVSELGVDCRYCHTSVEAAPSAGMPPTHTCMTCHSQLYTESDVLAPVRASYRTGQPLEWNRVYRLPDYVYFNHQAHVTHGVGCETCHGRVDQMPLVSQAVSLHMSWCLECHRNPEKYLRPREAVFAFGYALPPSEQAREGRRLVAAYGVPTEGLDDCSVCHR